MRCWAISAGDHDYGRRYSAFCSGGSSIRRFLLRATQVLRSGVAHRKAPIAIEAVKRFDALFAIEREIKGASPDERLAMRHECRPLIAELKTWLRA